MPFSKLLYFRILFMFLVLWFGVLINALGQNCFDGYEKLFYEKNKTLSYNEFHKLEIEFLESLVGCDAIFFDAMTLEGKYLNLYELKGRVVVLNFWFTTCLPCLKEIPELNKLVGEFNSDEVIFIGFARDDEQKLNAFFKKFGTFRYNIVPESYKIADAYKVVGWPQSVVIDKEGKIYKSWAGIGEGAEGLRIQISVAIQKCLEQ